MRLLAARRLLRGFGEQNPHVRQWLYGPIPRRSALFENLSCLALDLEMTGLDHQQHNMVSIGWVEIQRGAIQLSSATHLLIKAAGRVGQSATIHHIRDVDLQQGVTERQAMQQLLQASAGKVLVFHHAGVDMPFLNKAWKKYFGVPLLLPVVDTMRLEQQLYRRADKPVERGGLRLAACRQRYNLPAYSVHNALVDALATAELLLAIVQRKGEGGCQLRALLV